MRRTRTWTRNLLIGSTIAVTSLALSACCKDNKEETPTEAPVAEATATDEPDEPAEVNTDPEWKTKCPEAERPESGTVTALRTLQIYKEAKLESDKISTIGPGTWVNLLGAKGTWYCIDYPCDVGKLCPGWIEARYSKRKETIIDAGVKDAGVKKDAEVKDAEVKDAETKKDASRIKVPRFTLRDAGSTPPKSTRTPPGKRPPVVPVPK